MAGLRELKKERTRNLIIDTMVSMIEDRGYQEITVTDICVACEITAPTFYNYFNSKEAVLGQIYTDLTHSFVSAAAERVQADVSFEERLRSFTSDIARGAVENEALWKALMLWGDNTRDPESEMMAASEQFDSAMTALFRAGQESGELRADQSPRILGAVFDGAIHALGFRWACGGISNEDLEPAFHQAIAICLTGMA